MRLVGARKMCTEERRTVETQESGDACSGHSRKDHVLSLHSLMSRKPILSAIDVGHDTVGPFHCNPLVDGL